MRLPPPLLRTGVVAGYAIQSAVPKFDKVIAVRACVGNAET
jgi:hypothetical protein